MKKLFVIAGVVAVAGLAVAGIYTTRPVPSPLIYGNVGGYHATTYVLATETNVKLLTEQNLNAIATH